MEQSFELLTCGRLHLVDCHVKPFRVQAGWVYAEPGLEEAAILSDPETNIMICKIHIPEAMQEITFATAYYQSDEFVDFVRA